MQQEKRKTVEDLHPNDIVKSCPYLEMGSCFQLDGVHACVIATIGAPVIVKPEEINNKTITYEQIVERRKKLFGAINGLNNEDAGHCKVCINLREKKYKDVCFDYLGGEILPSGLNIQHYTECNERCKYCCYTTRNDFRKPQYSVLDYFEIFKRQGKLRGNNWIDFSGGEPAILKNFDEMIDYFLSNQLGTVVVYSNASIYSQSIYDALKENKIILTTSVDTGLISTYRNLRGANVFPKVIENLIKYRNSGTKNMWLKYVITEDNRTEDDMWSFLMVMLAIRPNSIMICPDFPYDDKEIPYETVEFAAKLWHLIEKFLGITPQDYSANIYDIKFVRYHEDLAKELAKLNKEDPINPNTILKYPLIFNENCTCESALLSPPSFLQKIFSIRNEGSHKVLRALGIKFKFRRKGC